MNKLKESAIKILKMLEKYTKTDMLYVAQGGSWLGLGQIVSMLSVFITSIAFADLLPKETFGTYKYVLSVLNILIVSTLTGMDSAISQSVARGYDGSFIKGVKTKIRWGFIGTISSIILAIYYYSQSNIELAIVFCIVSIFVPFGESFDMYNSLLWGKKLFNIQTQYNIVRKIISLVAIVCTLILTDNLYIILSVYFLVTVIPAGFFLYKTVKKYLSNKNEDESVIKYGKDLSAIYVISLIIGELDKILIFHYLGAIDLAVYAFAVAPNDQIKGVLKNLNSLAFPKFAQKNGDEIKSSISHKVLVLTILTATIILSYILIAPIFFKIFFPKYLISIRYSQILSISLIGAVISSFLYAILESQKARKQLWQYNIYGNIFNIIVLFPLVYYFGIWGAISSRFISRTFSAILAFRLVKKID